MRNAILFIFALLFLSACRDGCYVCQYPSGEEIKTCEIDTLDVYIKTGALKCNN